MFKFAIFKLSFVFLFCLAGLNAINGQQDDDVYSIGAGIADVTGKLFFFFLNLLLAIDLISLTYTQFRYIYLMSITYTTFHISI